MTPTPEAVVTHLGPRPGLVWLDGGDSAHGWSIVAWDPVDVITHSDAWPDAARALGAPIPRGLPEVPFVSGVIGYVGFEAGAAVAPIPAGRPTPEPAVWLGRYDGALCFRHRDGTWHPTGSRRARSDGPALLDAVPSPAAPPDPPAARRSTVDRAAYEASVRRILAWIRAGDCYQVNLTRPVFVDGAGPALPAYRRLRRADAPYGAYVQTSADCAVLSNSPELLLRIDGRRMRSTPIKGTRPRGLTEEEDLALSHALRVSTKDQAELTMIVDLVRNDLGRVAEIGSVGTAERVLTAHPTVHHAATDVSAILAPGRDAWDALAVSFPPGSVTGAPKVRACQRIRELEPHPRGAYCGAIGLVSDHGHAVFNVAIRTGVFHGDQARYHVGGGIVAASDPAEEWAETIVKEAALAAALGVSPAPV